MNQYLIGYLVVINVIALIVMGIDKRKAIINRWRISEKTLFLIALIGGAFGIFIAMKLFRREPLPLNKKQYLEGASFAILQQPNC